MQRVIKMAMEQKYNLGLKFWNQRKDCFEQIEPDEVNIIVVYDEDPQELEDNEEEDDKYVDNVEIKPKLVLFV